MRNRITIVVLLLFTANLSAQNISTYEKRLYDSYVDGDMLAWSTIMQDMSTTYQKSKNKELLYSLCFAQYGYIGYCISREMDKEAESVLKKAMNNAKELEKAFDGRHDILALQGAFIGYRIMLSKFSSLYLGPRAFKLIKKSSKSSHKYFNCSLEFGNFRYFTPKFLGGSKEEAIGYYQNAVRLLERKTKNSDLSWIYINTSLLLAHAYHDTNKMYLACQLYKKILEYEPQANWIRDEYNERCK